jgi:GntR family transcriptional regulator
MRTAPQLIITMPDKVIDPNKPKKLYVQVLEAISEEIESGRWPVGSQIPIEDELCKKYQVSKATIRFALLELVRNGFLMRHQGRGTFVCKKTSSVGMTVSAEFDEFMIEAITPFSVRVLVQTVMTPVDDLEIKLEAAGESHVVYIRRLVLAENEPVLIEESYVPYRICPDLLQEDIDERPLVEILEKKFQIPITRIKTFIEVAAATENEGMLLGLTKGAPLLLLSQHFYSDDLQVMYMRTVKRPDKFRFAREFRKK